MSFGRSVSATAHRRPCGLASTSPRTPPLSSRRL
jgi:hypothetical protein